MIANLLWVGLGGALGAMLRFATTLMIGAEGRFPWATLVINIAGSFAIGAAVGLWQQQTAWFDHWGRPLLVTGILGGFTTFSAFSLETVNLILAGRITSATAYATLSVAVSVGAAWAGLRLTIT